MVLIDFCNIRSIKFASIDEASIEIKHVVGDGFRGEAISTADDDTTKLENALVRQLFLELMDFS
jgi:hypothetical protein